MGVSAAELAGGYFPEETNVGGVVSEGLGRELFSPTTGRLPGKRK